MQSKNESLSVKYYNREPVVRSTVKLNVVMNSLTKVIRKMMN